jgi:uncharacterized protein YqgC (DUF456 family)
MTGVDVLAAIAIAIGLVGIAVPVLPGSVLVLAAVLGWAAVTGGVGAWTVFGVAALLITAGAVVKYAVPGRRLRLAGVPTRTLVLGGLLGVVGFFLVPVVGLPLGFVLGVFLAEWARCGEPAAAWRATVHSLRAIGLGMLIELGCALAASAVWTVTVLA